jgi:hypothetical protein
MNKEESKQIVGEEKNLMRQLLNLSGGSRDKSQNCIKIDDSIEVIGSRDFLQYDPLNEIIVSSKGLLIKIDGFQKCTSLCRT